MVVESEYRQGFAKRKTMDKNYTGMERRGAAKANVFGCLAVPLPYIYMRGRAGSPALLLIGVGAKGERTWTPSPILFLLGLPFFPFPRHMGF